MTEMVQMRVARQREDEQKDAKHIAVLGYTMPKNGDSRARKRKTPRTAARSKKQNGQTGAVPVAAGRMRKASSKSENLGARSVWRTRVRGMALHCGTGPAKDYPKLRETSGMARR